MAIGIIGSGTVGRMLAKQFIKAGNSVVISKRRHCFAIVNRSRR